MPTDLPLRAPTIVGHGFLLTAALIFAATAFAQQPASAPAVPALTAPWQPQIHFSSPPNWINDPNGPVLLNGQYHLFFQLNPFADQWGHMSWGHAVSPDLVHWKQLPVALAEEQGVAIFSGSTVVDADNTSGLCADPGQKTPVCMVAIYTGASQDKQTQNIAFSRNGGATWTKYSANPVIDLGPAGAVAGVWECPDLFELPIYDEQDKLVATRLLLNVNINPDGPAGGSADQYFIGQFDGSRFIEDHPGSGPHWVHWGNDFYASTSFSNLPASEDRTWIGWMSNWKYASKLPSLPGRGEMTLARHLYLREPPAYPPPTPDQEPLLLVQEPVLGLPVDKRYLAMFGAPAFQTVEKANERISAKKLSGSVYRLRFTLDPGDASEAGVRLRRSSINPDDPSTEETVVGIDQARGRIFVDRTRSGRTDWSSDFPARVSA